MNIGHDDERVAFEVTAANIAHHPYHYTHIYTYKTNIPEFFQIFFEKKIIAKIIKRSKLSTRGAKNIFFLSLSSM